MFMGGVACGEARGSREYGAAVAGDALFFRLFFYLWKLTVKNIIFYYLMPIFSIFMSNFYFIQEDSYWWYLEINKI